MNEPRPPSWKNALAPCLTELIRVPLVSPIRTLVSKDLIPEVPGAIVRFPQWTGPAFQDDLGKKSAGFVELDGEHLFAELAVLRLLERDGWEGRWIITRGTKHGEISRLVTRWRDVPRDEQRHAPIEDDRARQVLHQVATANKPARYAGCWDVFAWRGDEFAFFQCKRTADPAKERLKRPEEEWMRMAIASQPALFKAESFCFVLWDYNP